MNEVELIVVGSSGIIQCQSLVRKTVCEQKKQHYVYPQNRNNITYSGPWG